MLEVFKWFGAPLFAGIVSAYLTNSFGARFSFRRFRQEQWWQKKLDAYEAIVRKLSDIRFTSGAHLDAIETGRESPAAPKRQKELAWSLQEIASTGAFIVSDRAAHAVQDFLNAHDAATYAAAAGDFHKMLEQHYTAAETAIAVIRSEAHRELGVGETAGWRKFYFRTRTLA